MRLKRSRFYLLILLCLLYPSGPLFGAPMFSKSSKVSMRCGACHKPDPAGALEVIEETRKTPEEWMNVMIRMDRLNNAAIDDADYKPLVKELSKELCLSPSEMKRVAYINSDDNNQKREIPRDKFEERVFAACVRCHTFGKIISHRMTATQWKENRNLHLGYYPTVVPQMREMDWTRESMDLIQPLTEAYPFNNPEWKSWLEKRSDQDLSGSWKVAGYQPGMGYYDGSYTFTKATDKGEDEYLVTRKVSFEGGFSMVQKGTASLYSEYHLRYALAPTPLTGRVEGVFDLDAATDGFLGKWWTVIQDNNATGTERFVRETAAPAFIAAVPAALKKGEKTELTLIGVGLPESIAAKDIAFSNRGITALALKAVSKDKIVCTVEVAEDVPAGKVTVSVKGVKEPKYLGVFERINRIKVFPAMGRARVSSGAAYPPQGVQFVAYGVSNGPDRKPETGDDLLLEPVDASWLMDEEKTREDDDDLKYLFVPMVNGLYTPITTYGPIMARKQHREGVGLVGVTATYEADGKALTDRARLAVTDPDFIPQIK